MGTVLPRRNPHARRLRRDSTDVERRLWQALRSRQLEGFKFRRQASKGAYVVDFLCIEAGLAIELDGGQHEEEADSPRTAYLRSQGFDVLRFPDNAVIENLDGVLDSIRLSALRRIDGG